MSFLENALNVPMCITAKIAMTQDASAATMGNHLSIIDAEIRYIFHYNLYHFIFRYFFAYYHQLGNDKIWIF